MTYKKKLLNPKWQRKRLSILERDNWTCQHCLNTTKTLEVHHINYKSNCEPWDHPDDLLQTLCSDCHSMLEGIRPGSVILKNYGFWYDGQCPWCNSDNIREKGSFDKCNNCGKRIEFYPID